MAARICSSVIITKPETITAAGRRKAADTTIQMISAAAAGSVPRPRTAGLRNHNAPHRTLAPNVIAASAQTAIAGRP